LSSRKEFKFYVKLEIFLGLNPDIYQPFRFGNYIIEDVNEWLEMQVLK
tara:strand:+ start:596 stop:739 length:144 start_codon:yes stop_codon:yes gene_type:complete